jgi:predicted dehydrogenase
VSTSAGPLGIGIIGLGKVSPAHIEGYLGLPGEAQIVAVCDTDEVVMRSVSSELGVPGFTDHERLLAQPYVAAVVLLLPHLLHHPIAVAALESGKHVTIEKPLAISQAQCDELIVGARRRGLVLSVSENSRFVESYLETKRLVDEGWTGPIRLVRAFIYGSALRELALPKGAWKRQSHGFAAILDAATHFFYVLKWMFGSVASLQTVGRRWAESHGMPECVVEDGAVVTGTLASGGHFSIEVALSVEVPWGERFEIYGNEGSLICDQLANPPVTMYRSAEDYGTPLSTVRADPRSWRNASIRRGAADFVRAVREGRPPAVTADDAAYAVRLAECAYRSLSNGGTLVEP